MYSSAELFAAMVTAGVVVTGVLLGDAGLTAGQLVAFLFLVALFIEPVQLLVEVLDQAQTAAAGIRRVLGVIDTPADVPDPAGADGRGGRRLPPGRSRSPSGVRFRYDTGGDVLQDLDVTIGAGRRVAVVGETGSGKSTFVKLVTRLLDPVDGTITPRRRPAHGGPVRRAAAAGRVRPPGRVPVRRQRGRQRPLRRTRGRRRGDPRAFESSSSASWVERCPRGSRHPSASAGPGCRPASAS
jgi:hypothetical protein